MEHEPQSRLTWSALLEHPFVKDDSMESGAVSILSYIVQ